MSSCQARVEYVSDGGPRRDSPMGAATDSTTTTTGEVGEIVRRVSALASGRGSVEDRLQHRRDVNALTARLEADSHVGMHPGWCDPSDSCNARADTVQSIEHQGRRTVWWPSLEDGSVSIALTHVEAYGDDGSTTGIASSHCRSTEPRPASRRRKRGSWPTRWCATPVSSSTSHSGPSRTSSRCPPWSTQKRVASRRQERPGSSLSSRH